MELFIWPQVGLFTPSYKLVYIGLSNDHIHPFSANYSFGALISMIRVSCKKGHKPRESNVGPHHRQSAWYYRRTIPNLRRQLAERHPPTPVSEGLDSADTKTYPRKLLDGPSVRHLQRSQLESSREMPM